MQDRVYLGLPLFPPKTQFLFLVTLNLIFSFYVKTQIIFRMMAFMYGSLMLFQVDNKHKFPKKTVVVNFIVIIFYMSGRSFSMTQQLVTISILCVFIGKYLIIGMYDIILSLTVRPVHFQTVFFAIQLGILAQFFAYFTGIKLIKIIPFIIRILLNLRVLSFHSVTGIIRFSLKIVTIFLMRQSMYWIALQIILSVWTTGVNYRRQFNIPRIAFKGGNFFYPRLLILWIFLLQSFLQWIWYFGGSHAGTLAILKKMLWNYLRLESRASQRPGRSIIRTIIMQNLVRKQLHAICL